MRRRGGALCWIALTACGSRAIAGTSDAADGSTSNTTTTDAPPVADSGPSPSGTSASTATTSTTTVGSSTTVSDESGESSNDDSACSSFVCIPDMGSTIEQCDPMGDDCPDGEKCVWYADPDGGGLRRDAARCIPVTGDVPPFHPCVLPNGIGPDITDDCDARSYCLEVYGTSNDGFCAPYLRGDYDCSDYPGSSWAEENGSSFPAACLIYDCDPLDANACDEGMSCLHYPAFLYGSRMCWFAPDIVAPPIGSACEYATGCGDGNLCLDVFYLEGCADDRCCTQWCDVDAPSCDDPSLVCERYPEFDEQSTLGACVSPGTLER